MLIAFLLSILAIGIYRYEMINRPKEIFETFGDDPPTNEEFFDDRIVDLTVACERNSSRNDRRAKLLFLASIFMLLGLFLHGVYFLMRGLPLQGII